jgi:hypothetical protein
MQKCMTKMSKKCMTMYDKIKMYDKNDAKNGEKWAKIAVFEQKCSTSKTSLFINPRGKIYTLV